MLVFTVISTLLILFLAMIVVGFVRFRKPESGWLLIIGFLGLGGSVLFTQLMSITIGHWGIFSYYAYGKLYNLLLYFWFLPIICPLILVIIGFSARSHRHSNWFKGVGLVGLLIAVWLVGSSAPSWITSPDKIAESEIKANVHSIQIGLERYAVEHGGLYPESIEILIDQEYLTRFPQNPFTSESMESVPYDSPDNEGDFTYLPVRFDDDVRGYYLIGYGSSAEPGMRLVRDDNNDHVIIIIDANSADIPLPEIEEVIESAVMTEL